MKNLVCMITVICMGLTLTACGGKASVTETSETLTDSGGIMSKDGGNNSADMGGIAANPNGNSDLVISRLSGKDALAAPAPSEWATEKWTYYTAIGDSKDALLHVTDHSTGKSFVLCNRPDCRHNSEDCGAFLPPSVFEDAEDSRNSPNSLDNLLNRTFWVWSDGDYIYANNGNNDFYRFNFDGSGRTEVVRVPDKYNVSVQYSGISTNCWIMNEKMYICATVIKLTGNAGLMTERIKVMIEVDCKAKTVRELWEQRIGNVITNSLGANVLDNSVQILGGLDGKFYFMETECTSSGIIDKTTVFSVNTTDAALDVIYTSAAKDKERFNCDLSLLQNGNPAIFYLNGVSGAFIQFDLITRESSVIAEGFTGDWNAIAYRGRLVASRYDDNSGMSERRFIDISSGQDFECKLPEIVKIKDGYFYIILDEKFEEIETDSDIKGPEMMRIEGDDNRTIRMVQLCLIGRIAAEDYFANNEGAIKEIGWSTLDELYE